VSTAPTEGTGLPAGPAAAAERVREIQALIASARAGATGEAQSATTATTAAAGAPSAFASMLQEAEAPVSDAGAGYETLVAQAAARNGVDPALLHGLIQQESNFDPSSTSSAGAMGLTQLMPSTASSLGVSNPLDPAESIEGGARYLRQMLDTFGGNTEDALAAYNAGAGAVQHYGGVPPYAETQSYVSKVLGYAETFRQSQPVSSAVQSAATVATALPGVVRAA
jgi:soluble lytic murein transglycosylase-like protein